MDEKLLLEPNYHSEVYRNLTTNLDVTVLENFLDFIEVSEGKVVEHKQFNVPTSYLLYVLDFTENL